MSAAACLLAAASCIPHPSTPSTSGPACAGASGTRCRRRPGPLLRCSPARRRGSARALDERLLAAAAAEESQGEEAGVDVGGGFLDAEGGEVGEQAVVEEEQRPPAKAFVKSRRQRQEEEEAAAGQDRFKLINGKEVAACSINCFGLWFGVWTASLSCFSPTNSAACAKSDNLMTSIIVPIIP